MRDRLAYQPYFRELADRLALRDWMIAVKDDAPDDSDCLAAISCTEGRRRAWVLLSETYLRSDEVEQRHITVHELVHCHWEHACRIAAKMLDRQEFAAYQLAVEYGIDALADAIAPLMPLPSDVLDAPVRQPVAPGRAIGEVKVAAIRKGRK